MPVHPPTWLMGKHSSLLIQQQTFRSTGHLSQWWTGLCRTFPVHTLTFIAAERGWDALSFKKTKRNAVESFNVKQKRFDFWLVWAAQCEPEGRISLYLWKDCQVDWAGSCDERRMSGRRRRVLFLLFNPACRGVCGMTDNMYVCVQRKDNETEKTKWQWTHHQCLSVWSTQQVQFRSTTTCWSKYSLF